MQIEINKEQIDRSFTKREKLAVWLLLTTFSLVVPMTWVHQFKQLEQEVKELMG